MIVIVVLYVLAIPLWLPPVVMAARSKGLSSEVQSAAIVLASVSPAVALWCFNAVNGYCGASIGPGSGVIGEGSLWPQCPSAGLAWLSTFLPPSFVGVAAWILAGGGSVRPAIGVAVLGGVAAVGVTMVSSDLRGDVLAQMHERQEAVMVELRAKSVEREAQADELCMAVPKELVPRVLSGLAGWSPGAWDGLPGELLAIDDISMYAIRGKEMTSTMSLSGGPSPDGQAATAVSLFW